MFLSQKSDAFPAAEEMFGDHVLFYRQPDDAAMAVKVRRLLLETPDLSFVNKSAMATLDY